MHAGAAQLHVSRMRGDAYWGGVGFGLQTAVEDQAGRVFGCAGGGEVG